MAKPKYEAAMSNFTVRLPASLLERLHARAAEVGKPVSDVIRDAVLASLGVRAPSGS